MTFAGGAMQARCGSPGYRADHPARAGAARTGTGTCSADQAGTGAQGGVHGRRAMLGAMRSSRPFWMTGLTFAFPGDDVPSSARKRPRL